ncbi:MAG: hypothetical protein EAZ89_11130 [Bacteroidetes bacterium]|nr:MAG: hypothetical protein EAZ89_11130 [Bacteroidota bacterium]
MSIWQDKVAASLIRLGQKIGTSGPPTPVLLAALEANHWFTNYYIQTALQGVRLWMQEKSLEAFRQKYPPRPGAALRIGIIAAGNLPLVGFHDVMITLLSGHRVVLRLSHQDEVLMRWLLQSWIAELPELDTYIDIVSNPDPEIDFLVATGSDNTARYLEAAFAHVPRMIRKNRFSMALLRPEDSEKQFLTLCEDVLLYNGLGCRNVSNFLLLPGVKIERLSKILTNARRDRINPLYLERLDQERAQRKLLAQPYTDAGTMLLLRATQPSSAAMGVGYVIDIQDDIAAEAMIEAWRDQIQCIAGRDTAFGTTQFPRIDDFADGKDLMLILSKM